MDFKLDSTTGDLYVENFGLVVTQDAVESLAHRLKVKLQLFKGEWFLDLNAGVPYYQEVFVKGKSKDYIDSIFRAIITNTTDVKSISEYQSTFNRTTREFSFSFKVVLDSTGTTETINITI